MIAVTGASIGPIPLAIAFDLLGSYSETLLALALYPASCAIIALLFLKTPARLLAQQQSAELE
jgi:hypothetical protein